MNDALQSLFVLGSTHHQAPLEVRERMALTADDAARLQQELHAHTDIRECLVVNTCNRVEVYGLGTNGSNIENTIRDYLCARNGVSRELLDAHSCWHTNLDVLQHAFEVSCGLDSQMVGETDILGQMKEAYANARAAKCTGSVLNRLFEKSFQAAKSARTQTGITRGQVSIGNVAVDLANRIFGHLRDSRVLLMGSGDVAEKTAQSLKSRGVADITVASRTFENAHLLAHRLGGAAIELSDFGAQLKRFDIVISSTSAPGLILERDMIAAALKQRPDRPFFLIDVALPRDIAPTADTLENVYLYNLDDLSTIANENLELRKAEIERARTILKGYAWNLWLQLRRRTMMAEK
jgi:glutamyl-tRNA reductase